MVLIKYSFVSSTHVSTVMKKFFEYSVSPSFKGFEMTARRPVETLRERTCNEFSFDGRVT